MESVYPARNRWSVRSFAILPPPYQTGRSPFAGRSATGYPATTSSRPAANLGRISTPCWLKRRMNSPSSSGAAAAPRTSRSRRREWSSCCPSRRARPSSPGFTPPPDRAPDYEDEESSVDPAVAQLERTTRLGWLADADRDKAEEHFERFAGDRDLAAELERQKFAGSDYNAFANDIARYG